MEASAERVGFPEWYPAAHRRVLAALVAYSGSVEEASDATDEAFARALARWERVSLMTSPEGWVFVVARNVLRRSTRRRWRERSVAAAASVSADSARDASAGVLAAIELAAVLAALSERQREVVVLHHGLDLAQDTVASLLGISRSTVATTLLDARVALGVTTKGGARA